MVCVYVYITQFQAPITFMALSILRFIFCAFNLLFVFLACFSPFVWSGALVSYFFGSFLIFQSFVIF